MTHFVITANRLIGGEVLYRTAAEGWSPWIKNSGLAETKTQAEVWLERAGTTSETLKVVDPYIMKVQFRDEKITPLGQRERIRARGPSVHPQFEKTSSGGSYV